MLSVLIVRCAGFLRSYKRVGASTIYTDLLLELNDVPAFIVICYTLLVSLDHSVVEHKNISAIAFISLIIMSPIKHESSFALQALCIIRQIMYK
ncbi:unnamed protein product [Cylicocyclus nassatus]|uniref:Uncharacterized protein n=1 Tax=Cylicocyclus nassatus TaxID=53992 RepID=A0AA36GKF2_CYLNA|nr:unnamed protein product [Cylicocyclus nassatus]